MNVRTAERRHNVRLAASYAAVLRDHRNRAVLARGRTADISEHGVFLLLRPGDRLGESPSVCVTLTVPADPVAGTRRQVTYRCRVIHRLELGNRLGLGLEFISKLA